MHDQNKIIFTGGSGLLGTAFKKIMPGISYPPSSQFNVTDFGQMDDYVRNGSYGMIIHAAAFTSPPKIEQEPLKAIDVNIIGTANIVRLCMTHALSLVYISTDYVFRGDKGSYREDDEVLPVNRYAWSKLGGECAARMYDKSLIIRTTFGPDVFPYEKAFTDQWTSRESVTKTAAMIARLIETGATGTVHVGGPRKTVFEYAKALDPTKDIKELSINDLNFRVPADTSLDCSRFNALVKKN
ncbi:MAG TPA: sugar nucleotide-binding protein [Spirochaetota bacterium]|nr:sugar nucleotide-binding protein [Spirochaetota bacterium]